MPKGVPPEDYYDEPDDAADADGAYDANGDYYDEYTENVAYDDRLEVAPDDADLPYEVYDQVYQQVTAQAEARLDRPRRARQPRATPAPGPLRRFWQRAQPAVRRTALSGALIALVLVVFAYYWSRPNADRASSQAPSIAPPVVRCGGGAGGWPHDVAIAGHTLPALINNALTRAGEQHGYQFHGEAGQVWALTVEPRGAGGLDPLLRVFDQAGREVAAADDRGAQDFAADVTFVLPETSAYCVLVASSQGGMTSGEYRLAAWPLG